MTLGNITCPNGFIYKCTAGNVILFFSCQISGKSQTIGILQDKPSLFKSFYKWLKPGGKVLISDYCRSAGTPSAEFAEYIKQRGYDLHDVNAYGQVRSCIK